MDAEVLPDGKILVLARNDAFNAPFDEESIAIARFLPDGSLDDSFAGDGRMVEELRGTDLYAINLSVQADGKILVFGAANQNKLFLARFFGDFEAPTAQVAGPDTGVRGQKRSFALEATGNASPSGNFAFAIDWENDGIVDERIIGPSGTIVEHVFATNASQRTFRVVVTATDAFGVESGRSSRRFALTKWDLQTDALQPSAQNLVYGGSLGIDGVDFVAAEDGSVIIREWFLNNHAIRQETVVIGVTGRIIVYGQAGNDVFDASALTHLPVEFHGEQGDDILRGGSRNDLLDGGDGNDWIEGNGGDDVLMGDMAMTSWSAASEPTQSEEAMDEISSSLARSCIYRTDRQPSPPARRMEAAKRPGRIACENPQLPGTGRTRRCHERSLFPRRISPLQ
ncbi:MAG: hypothetical protein U1D30_25380 [Planctomycetota bacterium]